MPAEQRVGMRVKIEFTVEVDREAYADYYGIDSTAASVRTDLRNLMGGGAVANMVPHLFDAGIVLGVSS